MSAVRTYYGQWPALIPRKTRRKRGSIAHRGTAGSASFQCRLDGPGATVGSYQNCVMPASYNGLAVGTYVFRVRATDAAGNVESSPPSSSFTRSALRTMISISPYSTLVDTKKKTPGM